MIRNIIFSILFFFGIVIISLIFLPAFFLPKKIVLIGGKLMGYWTGFCLKVFLSTKITIKGKENMITNERFFIAASHQSMFETFYLQTIFNSPIFILKKELLRIPIFGWYLKKIGSISIQRDKITIKGKENMVTNERFFIAASHQSMFETFYLQTIFNSPIFILKKELLLIPIFGWYLKKIGSISIQRNKITKDNLGFFENISKKISNSNQPLIIFPQGTRVLPDKRPPFKKGASRIYEELKITCQPVAINSGHVWPKKGLKHSNKTITISILKPIEPKYSKEEFMKILENDIYSELNLLN